MEKDGVSEDIPGCPFLSALTVADASAWLRAGLQKVSGKRLFCGVVAVSSEV